MAAPNIASGFIPRVQRLEPVPYDPENYSRWTKLLLQKYQLYGISDIADRTRVRPTLPELPAALPADANDAARLAHQNQVEAYRFALHEQQRYDFDVIQLSNLFYSSLGREGMAELELRDDECLDVFKSMELI